MGGQKDGPKLRAPSVGYGWVWPGLAPLWTGGEWSGFGWAAGFGLALNGVVAATYVYDDWIGSTWTWSAWASVGLFWIVGAFANRRWLKRYARRASGTTTATDLYPEAFHEYLQGNWFAAETKCRNLIRANRDDAEARLLLATLLRHVDRHAEARKELDLLSKLDSAAKWRMEIGQERKLLNERIEGTLDATTSDTNNLDAAKEDAEAGSTPATYRATRLAA
ncbi:MAG: hypothetical protein K8U03_26085 [Planctomycetia bacterium]|nr:hypothetical protein [Planctomycetia bacterium]